MSVKRIIERAIEKYSAADFDRYHTPGHKGALCREDITELGECGSIFPSDAVRLAEESCARLYGVRHLRFSVGGSSAAIKAALLAFRGKKVLYSGGAHRAFGEGCELAGIDAVPISEGHGIGAEYTEGCEFLPPPATVEQVRKALESDPDASAVFITSPDCLGRSADIGIAELCRKRKVKLIADAAHGAHFAFADGLREYGFERVASVCNMSAHKTLGAYTQTALLAVNDPFLIDPIDRGMKLMGTTSPNYELYSRLEISVEEASEATDEYKRLRKFVTELRGEANLLPNTDYTRLCVKPRDCTANELFARLVERKIMPEAVLNGYVVFILTPYDGEQKLERLRKALRELA